MSLRPVRILTTLLVAFGLALAVSGVAPAAPGDDLQAQAKALEEQLAANGAKIAALGEQLNGAQLELDTAQASIADAEVRIEAARAETGRLKTLVRERAAAIYRQGGVASGSSNIFEATSALEANARAQYGEVASQKDNALLDELAAARADLAVQKSDAQDVREAAQAQRDALAAAKAEADAAAAAQQGLLDQVKGEIAELVRAEQARRAAAAAVAPKAGKGWTGPVPNPAGGAGAAVAFAQAQLGKPYEYAAAGPDTYDCSGLTMRAWQAGGVSMPHYSGAQGSMFPRVPLDQLQPGDLITSSSWPAHVGIWVGGGYIHATHTGDVIKYVAGSGSVRDAVRPG